ncbi:MAG: hypothetical protein NPINA01_24230 [Nitrospinaceae bacterium]|nr:MAG: hypothetical protein NPINA01_24230 [Nitrospinaceae bacterium]
MNDKVLIIAIAVLLGIGILSVLLIVIPWVWERGIPNWKELLMDDGLILMAIAMFVYGFYMNTKMH